MSYKTNVLLPAQGNSGIFAFDVDVKQRNVYFTKKNSICYFPIFGGNDTCVLSNMVYVPGDIAVDPLRNYIYWTDYVTKKIYLAKGNGQFWTVIIWENLNIPSSISVAYKHGYIFWSDIGKPVSISRANTDGTFRRRIITSSIKLPNSLAVDHSAQRLYWSDFRRQSIEQCDFNGNNRIVIARSLSGPTSVALLGRFIYWSEWKSEEIKRADKKQGINGVVLIKGMGRVNGIKAVNLRRVPVSTNTCDKNNGGCSHFCMVNITGLVTCACPVGLKLLEDRKQCTKSPVKSLFISTGHAITRISLDTYDLTAVILPFEKLYGVISFAYDVVVDRIYWTNTKGIFSAFSNGSDTREIIKTNLSISNSLVVDWIGRNLYWTDSDSQTIEVSRVDGTNRGVLISEMLEGPRDLAVHPAKGYLFWTDCGNNSRIERSYLDGRSRTVLINRDIYDPTGLTVDVESELLYWADSFYQTIQRCNLEGEKRSLVIKKSGHVFGLALFGSYIYWTDGKKRIIHRANSQTGSRREILSSKNVESKAIIAISKELPQGNNACSTSNGNCSGLCLSTPTGRTCASICDEKLYLKDSCHSKEIVIKPTTQENTSCFNGGGEECSTQASSFVRKERPMGLVYIVGTIVIIVFIITMCVLAYVCLRRFKRAGMEKESRQNIIVPKVHFRKNKLGHTLNEKDAFASDPSITILPNNCPHADDISTGEQRYKKSRTVAYEPAEKTGIGNEERRCLTISDV